MSDNPTAPDSQELAQRFVQFIMIQAQNVLYVLGKIPGPDGTAPQPNLEAAKMLIDQLDMIQHKTSGNLSSQESKILKDTLSELQMAFVEASGGTSVGMMPDRSPKIDLSELEKDNPEKETPSPEEPASQASSTQDSPASGVSQEGKQPPTREPDSNSGDEKEKKKFFKSYG